MQLKTKPQQRNAGFSLIEIMFGVAILAIFMTSISQTQISASKLAARASHEDKVQSRLTRTIARVSSELRGIIDTSIWEDLSDPDTSSGVLTFQRVESLENGVAQPGPIMRLQFVLDTGEQLDDIDNDGDGLIDEGSVKLTRDPGGAAEMTATLCHNVREYYAGETLNLDDDNGNDLVDEAGFHIQRVGDQIFVRLAVEDIDKRGDSVIKSAQAAIRIRN